jgi:predicted oxidoreductase
MSAAGDRARRPDVIVIGAGVAGVACAIEAAEAGLRVVVVDAASTVGGTAAGAGGGTLIAGSALQDREGIADSIDLAVADWMHWGGDTVDADWAERYIRASAPVLFDGLSASGVRWTSVHLHEGNSVARWHRPEGGGRRVMALLEQRARALGRIDWVLGHRAIDLMSAGGRVTGVRLESDEGRMLEVSAENVVVTTGGFNNDPVMVAAHSGEADHAERILLGGGRGARGEGHRMLESVGAQFTQLDAVWMYPYGTPDPRDPARGLAVRSVAGELWINDDGERFHDEQLRGGATGTTALLAQPHGRCWSVIDAAIASRMVIADPFYSDGAHPIRDRIEHFLRTSSFVVTAPRIEELADRMGVDRQNLRAALSERRSAIASGALEDPVFGGSLRGIPTVETPPFFAIRLNPMARKNLGGVRTDGDARVLDGRDRPIPGLLAAGEVAGMAGGRVNGVAALEGTAFGPSLFSGMVAGRTASR